MQHAVMERNGMECGEGEEPLECVEERLFGVGTNIESVPRIKPCATHCESHLYEANGTVRKSLQQKKSRVRGRSAALVG
jgi:hypothetical protein